MCVSSVFCNSVTVVDFNHKMQKEISEVLCAKRSSPQPAENIMKLEIKQNISEQLLKFKHEPLIMKK